jgi:2-methylcitrate dehydratase PrpD
MNAPVAASLTRKPLIAETLARFASTLEHRQLPAGISGRARLLMLDAIGVALAASGCDFAHRALTAVSGLGGTGDTAVIGMSARLSMRDAALVNGVLVHGLDFDDTHVRGVVHVTASVLPAVLAVGARERATGSELIAAYVAGMEVGARLGAAAKGGFHQAGFHPTGVVGAFAAALAAGKLMGLTEKQLVMAQGLALSLASGTFEFLEDGAWNKRLHPGWAAQAGITAAALARQGFVGTSRAYEGRFGLYATHLQERFDPDGLALATAGLGHDWELVQVAVKPFPACHLTHACIDAALALHHVVSAAEIKRVVALVPEEAVKIVCEPVAKKRRPLNAYDGQFSIPYLVAAALVRGRFTLAELEADALRDPAILALADHVEFAVDPQSGFPRYYSGEVVATARDGRSFQHREHKNRGCGDRPLTEAEILAKFHDNAGRAVAPWRADRIIERVLSLDGEDVRGLAEVLGG